MICFTSRLFTDLGWCFTSVACGGIFVDRLAYSTLKARRGLFWYVYERLNSAYGVMMASWRRYDKMRA